MTSEPHAPSSGSTEESSPVPIGRRAFLGQAVVGSGVFFPAILRAQAQRDIVIGAPLAASGVAGAYGTGSWRALQLACDVVNEAGGIKSMQGARLRPVLGDTESRVDQASPRTEKLINEGAVALIGCNHSAATMVATQIAERERIPFMCAYEIDPAITRRGLKYTFRHSPLLDAYARDLLGYIAERSAAAGKPARTMVILSDNSSSGAAADAAVKDAAAKLGITILDASKFEAGKTQNFTPYIAKYKATGVDIFMGFHRPTDGVAVMRAMKEMNFNPPVITAVTAAPGTHDFAEGLGRDADNVIGTNAWVETLDIPNQARLMKLYAERFQATADVTLASTFSNVAILVDALERAGTTDGPKLRDAIAATQLKTGERNFLLLNGVKFNAQQDNEMAGIVIFCIKDKVSVPVAPARFSKMTAPYPRPNWA